LNNPTVRHKAVAPPSISARLKQVESSNIARGTINNFAPLSKALHISQVEASKAGLAQLATQSAAVIWA
jgi:hypothetical protein